MLDVDVIEDPAAAVVALDPVRARLLAELAEPASAARARRAARPRAPEGQLPPADARGARPRARRRGAPLGRADRARARGHARPRTSSRPPRWATPRRPGPRRADRLSARYLIALAARLVREVGDAGPPRRRRRQHAADAGDRHRDPLPRRRPSAPRSPTSSPRRSPRSWPATTTRTAPDGRSHRLVVAAHPLPDRPTKDAMTATQTIARVDPRGRGPGHARGGLGGDRHRPRHLDLVRARRDRGAQGGVSHGLRRRAWTRRHRSPASAAVRRSPPFTRAGAERQLAFELLVEARGGGTSSSAWSTAASARARTGTARTTRMHEGWKLFLANLQLRSRTSPGSGHAVLVDGRAGRARCGLGRAVRRPRPARRAVADRRRGRHGAPRSPAGRRSRRAWSRCCSTSRRPGIAFVAAGAPATRSGRRLRLPLRRRRGRRRPSWSRPRAGSWTRASLGRTGVVSYAASPRSSASRPGSAGRRGPAAGRARPRR